MPRPKCRWRKLTKNHDLAPFLFCAAVEETVRFLAAAVMCYCEPGLVKRHVCSVYLGPVLGRAIGIRLGSCSPNPWERKLAEAKVSCRRPQEAGSSA
jgi:hypothetical protein